MASLQTFPFSVLRNDGSLNVLTRVSEEANELLPTEVGQKADSLQPVIVDFQRKVIAFTDAYKPFSKQDWTQLKADTDRERDVCWRSSNLFLKGMVNFPDPETAKLCRRLLDLYVKYGDPTSLERGEESSRILNLIEDIEEFSEAELKKAMFDQWLADLKAKQAAYTKAESDSVIARSEQVVGLVQSTRREAEAACSQLINVINVLVLLEGEERFASFISRVNVIFDEQRALLAHRATLNAKKNDDTPEV